MTDDSLEANPEPWRKTIERVSAQNANTPGVAEIAQMLAEIKPPTLARRLDVLQTENERLKARVKELEGQYSDLIMAVSHIYEGESRHETARRYIIERENWSAQPARGVRSLPEPDEGTRERSVFSETKPVNPKYRGSSDD